MNASVSKQVPFTLLTRNGQTITTSGPSPSLLREFTLHVNMLNVPRIEVLPAPSFGHPCPHPVEG